MNTNKRWERVERTASYRKAAVRELYKTVTGKIKEEVLDGILLNLNSRNREKSMSVQNRILRRIVEKRQAQANHRKNSRSVNSACRYITIACTGRCMNELQRHRMAV